MPIQFIGYKAKNADGTTSFDLTGSWTGGIGGPLQENDVLFISSCADAQAVANPTGWTSLYNKANPTDIQLSWKRMGATPDTSISPIEESDGVSHVVLAFRGVDPTTAFDATRTVATGATGMPNSPSITTVTPGAWVLSIGYLDDDRDPTATAPTGFTKLVGHAQSGSRSTQLWAYKEKATAGAEDPAVWTGAGTDEWDALSIALKPAPDAGSNPSDTVTVSETVAKAIGAGASDVAAASDSVEFTLTVPMPSPTRYTVNTPTAGGTISIYASPALTGGADTTRKHLVINIHGTNRNAGEYHQWALNGLALTTKRDETVIVSPYFRDNTSSAGSDPEGIGYVSTDLYWTSTGWRLGSKDASTYDYSSFDVLDDIIEGIIASGKFPNLERITVCGHSAGGQMTTRYCLFNEIDGVTVSLPMRYVPSNPSSYCYPDEYRPQFDGSWNVLGYYVPSVTGYNDYRYGLAGTTNAYIQRSTNAVHQARFKNRYHEPLLGEYDDEREVADPDFDSSDAANTQGQHRKMRGSVFKAYMDNRFPGNKHKEAVIVPATGHDGQNMWGRPVGRAALFETYNWELSDSVTPSDYASTPIGFAPTDSVTASDSVVYAVGKAAADTAAPTDAAAAALSKALSDTAAPSDVLANEPGKAASDSATAADSTPVKGIAPALSDSATAADSTPTKAVSAVLADTALPLDDIQVGVGNLSRSDSVAATDALTFSASKPLSDSAAPADTLAIALPPVSVSDSATPTDAATSALSRPDSDTATPADVAALAADKAFSDVATPADAAAKALSRAFSDSVTLADVLSAGDGAESYDDAVSLEDGGTWIKQSYVNGDYFAELYVEGQTGDINPPLVLIDSVTVTDVRVAGLNLGLSLSDSAAPTDALERHIGRPLEHHVEAEDDTGRHWYRTMLVPRHTPGVQARPIVTTPMFKPRVRREYEIGFKYTVEERGPLYVGSWVSAVDTFEKFYPPHPDENSFASDLAALDLGKVLTDSVLATDEFATVPMFPADGAPASDGGEAHLRNYVDLSYEAEVYVANTSRSF